MYAYIYIYIREQKMVPTFPCNIHSPYNTYNDLRQQDLNRHAPNSFLLHYRANIFTHLHVLLELVQHNVPSNMHSDIFGPCCCWALLSPLGHVGPIFVLFFNNTKNVPESVQKSP